MNDIKLIDLLVQELPKLGGWPEGAKVLSQDMSGRVYGYTCNEVSQSEGMWLSKSGNDMLPSSYVNFALAQDWMNSYITRAQYEAALAASQQPAWNGEGLPPVGCDCEVKSGKDSWALCRVVYSSAAGVAFIYLEETSPYASPHFIGVLDSIACKCEECFRPIRNEAERKREEILKELRSHVTNFNKTDVLHAIEEVYDAIAAGNIRGVKLDS